MSDVIPGLEGYEVAMARLEPINNHILFKFLDDNVGMKRAFRDRATASGIIVEARVSDQTLPRWGQVIAKGPDAHEVNVGEYILIEGQRWTTDTTIMGVQLWKTDEDQLLMTTADINETI